MKQWLGRKLQTYKNKNKNREVDFGHFRRLRPISNAFGYDRGTPIRRWYIERFLAQHSEDISGHILEIGEDTYTLRFGGERVIKSDVLHVCNDNPKATIVADLSSGEHHISPDSFDCIIFTQTLQFIYDVRSTIRTVQYILKPKGILLASFPGISQISRYDMDRWGEYWRFSTLSARRLFTETFFHKNIEVQAYGNVLTAVASLHGLAAEELQPEELDYFDPDYEVLITVRAIKR